MVQKNSIKPKIIIVVGPTASGKTKMGITLAKKFNGEIISADSMQIYKGMDIGTAKVKKEEMCGIKHHMLDVVSPSDSYSVSLWKEKTEKIIEDIIKRGKTPIIVGGTGLYITSLVKGYTFFEAGENLEFRTYLENYLKENGPEELYKLLERKNSALAKSVHPNKTKAIIRYLEILEENPTYTLEPQEEKYDYMLLGLDMEREKLYNRINKRVDKMLEEGLIEEVKNLQAVGVSKTSLGAIGYKEILEHLEGKITYDEAVALIKQRSRNYAKRQLTYMRKMDNIEWIRFDDIKTAQNKCLEFLNKGNI